MLVYVLNKPAERLMPCKLRKARLLLKEEKAKVVKRTPFTIQLLYGSSSYEQEVSLGVDAGTSSNAKQKGSAGLLFSRLKSRVSTSQNYYEK